MKAAIRPSRQFWLSAAVLTAAGMFASCATTPVQLSAVGPEPPVIHSAFGEGSLVVFSDTEAKRLDKGLPFYVHKSYLVEDQNGKILRWVPNHLGDMDQSPQRVTLPAGAFQIVADSTGYGRVRVPVVIEPGRTTEVHLDGNWKSSDQPSNASDLVRLPNAEIVGWRAPGFAQK
jgi:hypothetical protein